MSEIAGLLADSAERLFGQRLTKAVRDEADQGGLTGGLWDACAELGLDLAALTEARGGAGLTDADLCAMARLAGRHALPVPLVETWLAERALATAGREPLPEGTAATISPVLLSDAPELLRDGGTWRLSGTLRRVPHGRHARVLVVIAQTAEGWRTVRMDAPDPAALDRNYAGEPRDSFRLDGVSVTAIGEGGSRDDLHFDGALFRAAQMAGAMERVLDMTVAYAKERAQFGRTISKFQAVQQQIARLAGEAAAASAASHAAGDARSLGPARVETACAKLRAGEAAGEVAAIAHQVHGAVGFTHEYHLHFLTRRLWSWRDEFGSEAEWSDWVGAIAGKVGGEGLWAFLVKPDPALTAGPKELAGG